MKKVLILGAGIWLATGNFVDNTNKSNTDFINDLIHEINDAYADSQSNFSFNHLAAYLGLASTMIIALQPHIKDLYNQIDKFNQKLLISRVNRLKEVLSEEYAEDIKPYIDEQLVQKFATDIANTTIKFLNEKRAENKQMG